MKCIIPIFVASALTALAQDAAKVPPPKEVSPGVYEVGTVRVDKNSQTVTIPAKVNMVEGLVEYVCVTPQGSTHESVLVSEAGPQNVHVGMLLLGAKGSTPPNPAQAPGQIDAQFLANLPKLKGDRVQLTARWKDPDGKEQTAPIENWITQRTVVKKKVTEKPMSNGPWLYNGSYLLEGRFLADVNCVYVSVNTFPSALINNPREGAADDKMWFANKTAMPAVGTPVDFVIKLENAQITQK